MWVQLYIKLLEFDERTNYVYEFATYISTNMSVENNPVTIMLLLAKNRIQSKTQATFDSVYQAKHRSPWNCLTSDQTGQDIFDIQK